MRNYGFVVRNDTEDRTMDKKVCDEKELARALKDGRDEIEVEGDLCNKIVRIKATGRVAWVIAIGAVGVAVVAAATAPATGGAHTVAFSAVAAPAAVSVLGAKATAAALVIACAGGGIGVLNRLRGYSFEKISSNHIMLRRK